MSETVVLYVEDEADDVFFMRLAFEKEGFTNHLRSVGDGGDAIAYLSGTACYSNRTEYPFPQLILLDLNLPVRSGFEVLEWIRSHAATRDLPVVVFSSSGHKADRERADQLGANAYFLKPSSGLDFQETVQRLKREWLTNAIA